MAGGMAERYRRWFEYEKDSQFAKVQKKISQPILDLANAAWLGAGERWPRERSRRALVRSRF